MRWAGLLIGALAMSQAAAVEPSAASEAARNDRLADLIVRMIPLGPQFDAAAAADPRWPLQSIAAEDLKPQWLSCAREKLSTRGYREFRRAEMADYAKTYPQLVDADLAVLSAGAADVFAKLSDLAIEAGKKHPGASDSKVLLQQVIATTDPRQHEAVTAFVSRDEHQLLRRLTGIESVYGNFPNAKELFGDGIVQGVMREAVESCQIPKYLFSRPASG